MTCRTFLLQIISHRGLELLPEIMRVRENRKMLVSERGINIHIDADNKDGFTQDIERTLRENGKTLGFGNVEFE
jgi:hypothetical protein